MNNKENLVDDEKWNRRHESLLKALKIVRALEYNFTDCLSATTFKGIQAGIKRAEKEIKESQPKETA